MTRAIATPPSRSSRGSCARPARPRCVRRGCAAPPGADGQPAEIRKRTGPVGLVITGLEHLARTVVHYPSHIWLFAAIDRMDLFFWIYGGVNVLYLARTSLILLLRLGRFEPNP